MCKVLDRVIEQGRDEVSALVQFLIDHDRQNDLQKALNDKVYRNKLIDELLNGN